MNLLLIAAITFLPIPGKDYEVSKTEVTQSQWKEIMGNNPSKFKGDDLPVEWINFDDCIKFIDKLNLKGDGFKYRLPSKTEWEYLCNGDSKTKFFYGDSVKELGVVAWYRENTTKPQEVKPGDWQSVGGSTKEVGTKMANRFGLHDVHGNVMEWDAEGNIRGGSFFATDLDCSTFYAPKYPKETRCEFLGLRLLRERIKKVDKP